MNSSYITSAKKPEQLPPFDKPEIGIVGRSNCGKSSLINALLQHRQLARASRTPGRTQMANFFSVDDRVIVCDLPGYGWSETGMDVRKDWQGLLKAYVKRSNITHLLFLMDARRDLDDEERLMLRWLQGNGTLVMVLTKTDKLSKRDVQTATQNMQAELTDLGLVTAQVFPVSSLKKTGLEELRRIVGLVAAKT